MNKFKKYWLSSVLLLFVWCHAAADIPSQQALQDLNTQMTAKAEQYKAQALSMQTAADTHAKQYEGQAQVIADIGKAKWLEMMEKLKADQQDAAKQQAMGQQFQGLFIFASLGMPEMALKALLKQADHLGVPILIQGLLPQGFMATVNKMMQLVGADKKPTEGQMPVGGIVIEPNWFKHFGITQVPAFVLTNALNPCIGGNCKTTEHDVITGNISLYEALRIFKQKGSKAFEDQINQLFNRLSGKHHG